METVKRKQSNSDRKMNNKHITDIHICSKCGTVSIAGNDKCPSCGADELSGWHKSEIRTNSSKSGEIINRLKNAVSPVAELWKNNWKPVIAVITFRSKFVQMSTSTCNDPISATYI